MTTDILTATVEAFETAARLAIMEDAWNRAENAPTVAAECEAIAEAAAAADSCLFDDACDAVADAIEEIEDRAAHLAEWHGFAWERAQADAPAY